MPVKRRPGGHTKPISQTELNAVIDGYSLGDRYAAHHVLFEFPAPVDLNERTKTARKIFVDTPAGPWFIKQIPWYCDEPALNRFRQAWLEDLHRAGVAVPLPLLAKDGYGWVEVDDARYTATRSILGGAWSGGEQQLSAAMRLLASLHAVQPRHPELATQEDYFDLVADHFALAQELLLERGVDPSQHLTAAFAPRLATLREAAHVAGWHTLPKTGIHGDFSPWNIVLSADGRAALAVDFDNADFGQRLHDVAEVMFSFGLLRYRDKSTNFDSSARFGPIDAAMAPLQLYHHAAPLEPAEWACLPAVAEAFAIEVYCLGLMRGDYEIGQRTVMMEELDRLHDGLTSLPQVSRDGGHHSAADRTVFDSFHYVFTADCSAAPHIVSADFGITSSWDDLFAAPTFTGAAPAIFVLGGCICPGPEHVHAAHPHMAGSAIELAQFNGHRVLATAQLGDPDAAVAAVLRRTPMTTDTQIVLLDCTGCGANRQLAAAWRESSTGPFPPPTMAAATHTVDPQRGRS
jgi:Ser/Thr protein kinase RdoA (MazF antagonist)